MSWDPKTAIFLYDPIDFYALAIEKVGKSISNTKLALIQKEKKLSNYKPATEGNFLGRRVLVLKSGIPDDENEVSINVTTYKMGKIYKLQLSLLKIKEDFYKSTKNYKIIFAKDIDDVNNTIISLGMLAKNYYASWNDLYSMQMKSEF